MLGQSNFNSFQTSQYFIPSLAVTQLVRSQAINLYLFLIFLYIFYFQRVG